MNPDDQTSQTTCEMVSFWARDLFMLESYGVIIYLLSLTLETSFQMESG